MWYIVCVDYVCFFLFNVYNKVIIIYVSQNLLFIFLNFESIACRHQSSNQLYNITTCDTMFVTVMQSLCALDR